MRQIQQPNNPSIVGVPIVILLALLLVSCATTSPKATFTKELPKERRVDANDTTTVKVEASEGVALAEHEKQRLVQRIQENVDAQKMHNADSADRREYELDVLVTRYEKGNTFARFMLAGLGQIHIDAKVSVFTLPGREKVAEFEIDKTFAWGGVYGGVTSIEDVEQGLAEGIAEAMTR
jgi:hypothetical protein